jgi:hypothetical protein
VLLIPDHPGHFPHHVHDFRKVRPKELKIRLGFSFFPNGFRPCAEFHEFLVKVRRNGFRAFVVAFSHPDHGPLHFACAIELLFRLGQKLAEFRGDQALESKARKLSGDPGAGFHAPLGHVGAGIPMGDGRRGLKLHHLPNVVFKLP